jgi:hypothetical protein
MLLEKYHLFLWLMMMKHTNSTMFKVKVATPIHQTQTNHMLIMDKMKNSSGVSQKLCSTRMLSKTNGYQVKRPNIIVNLHHIGVKSLLCQLSINEKRWLSSIDTGNTDLV